MGLNRNHFDNLDGVRGAAAFVVLLAHLVQVHFLRFGLNTPLHLISSIASEYAVFTFFVLSGYLITHSLEMNIRRNRILRLDIYFAARIARLYPPFLFAVGISLLVFLVMELFGLPGRSVSMRLPGDIYAARDIVHVSLGQIVSSLLMLQGLLEINGSLWSLYIEAKLYVLAGCSLALLSSGRSIFSKTILAFVFCLTVIAALHLNPEFARYAMIWMVGSLTFYAFSDVGNRHLMLVTLIIAVGIWRLYVDQASLMVISLDLLIAFFISWLLFKRRVKIPWFHRLADSSYSLYVVHFPILLLLQSLLISTGIVSVGSALGVASLSAIAAVGLGLFGGVIESKKTIVQNSLLELASGLTLRKGSDHRGHKSG